MSGFHFFSPFCTYPCIFSITKLIMVGGYYYPGRGHKVLRHQLHRLQPTSREARQLLGRCQTKIKLFLNAPSQRYTRNREVKLFSSYCDQLHRPIRSRRRQISFLSYTGAIKGSAPTGFLFLFGLIYKPIKTQKRTGWTFHKVCLYSPVPSRGSRMMHRLLILKGLLK